MPEDDTIGRIIRRDLDRLPMLPADRWVPRTLPKSRPIAFTLFASTVAVALGLVLAIGIGQGLRTLREGSAPLSASSNETFILANPTGLLVLDAQGQTLRHVVDLPPQSQPSTPALNPSRTALTFVLTQIPSTATGFGSDIYTVNVDGTGLRALVAHEADNIFYGGPVFDPSGSYLYFYRRAPLIVNGSFTGNDDTIQRLDLRTGERRTIISGGVDPAISPDGKLLVYVRPAGPGTTNTLWRANSDGTSATPFFAPGVQSPAQLFLVQSPRFAATTCAVAFVGIAQSSGPGEHIFIAPCDGSSLRAVGDSSQHGTATWSPDSTQLAYVSAGSLYVVDVRSGNIRSIGFGNKDFTFGDVAWLRVSAPAPQSSPASSAARDAILKRFSQTNSEIRRVDRIDAKVMTRRDFEQGSNNAGTSTSPNTDLNQVIWVVAISGEVVPQFGRGSVFTWGIYLVNADTGDILGMLAGGGPWPPYFDGLPTVPGRASATPTVPGRASATPTFTVTARPGCGHVETGDIQVCPGSGSVGTAITVQGRSWSCTVQGARVDLVFVGYEGEGIATGAEGGFSFPPIQPDAKGDWTVTVKIPAVLDPDHGRGGGPTTPGIYRIISKPAYCTADFGVTP